MGRARHGFTTIEAAVGIVLLSLMAAISYPAWKGLFDDSSSIPAKGRLANFEVQLTKVLLQSPDGFFTEDTSDTSDTLHSHLDALGVPGIDTYHPGEVAAAASNEVSVHAIDNHTAVVTTLTDSGACLVLWFGGDDEAWYGIDTDGGAGGCQANNTKIEAAATGGALGSYSDPAPIDLTP